MPKKGVSMRKIREVLRLTFPARHKNKPRSFTMALKKLRDLF